MMRWSRGGFQFWAVSDVSAPDLAEFVRLLETRTRPNRSSEGGGQRLRTPSQSEIASFVLIVNQWLSRDGKYDHCYTCRPFDQKLA